MTQLYRAIDTEGRSVLFVLWETSMGVSVSKLNYNTRVFEAHGLYEGLDLKQTKKILAKEVDK